MTAGMALSHSIQAQRVLFSPKSYSHINSCARQVKPSQVLPPLHRIIRRSKKDARVHGQQSSLNLLRDGQESGRARRGWR